MRTARHDVAGARAEGRQDKRAHDDEKLARREEAVQRQIVTAVDKYAAALELFDQWKAQGVKDAKELDAALRGKSDPDKLAELRRQIEMRTVGCGWTQFSTKWTFFSDEKEHTLAKLRKMLLEDVLPHEMALRTKKKLPTKAAPPQLKAHTLKELGTADADVLRIEATSVFDVSKLLQKAEAAREEREARGISDRTEAAQPPKPPPFDTRIVGKRFEVCWPYKLPDGTTVKVWASGTCRRVADGLTDKTSARAKKILPAGAVLWGWDADPEYDEVAGEKWLILRPSNWNRTVQYAWRYDPCELGVPGRAKPPPRRPTVEPETDDELMSASDDDM